MGISLEIKTRSVTAVTYVRSSLQYMALAVLSRMAVYPRRLGPGHFASAVFIEVFYSRAVNRAVAKSRICSLSI